MDYPMNCFFCHFYSENQTCIYNENGIEIDKHLKMDCEYFKRMSEKEALERLESGETLCWGRTVDFLI